MKRQKRRKPEEIIMLLRKYEASGMTMELFCKQQEVSTASLIRWRKQFGQMSVSDVKRLKALEKENAELKKMYADAMPSVKILKSTIEKKL